MEPDGDSVITARQKAPFRTNLASSVHEITPSCSLTCSLLQCTRKALPNPTRLHTAAVYKTRQQPSIRFGAVLQYRMVAGRCVKIPAGRHQSQVSQSPTIFVHYTLFVGFAVGRTSAAPSSRRRILSGRGCRRLCAHRTEKGSRQPEREALHPGRNVVKRGQEWRTVRSERESFRTFAPFKT